MIILITGCSGIGKTKFAKSIISKLSHYEDKGGRSLGKICGHPKVFFHVDSVHSVEFLINRDFKDELGIDIEKSYHLMNCALFLESLGNTPVVSCGLRFRYMRELIKEKTHVAEVYLSSQYRMIDELFESPVVDARRYSHIELNVDNYTESEMTEKAVEYIECVYRNSIFGKHNR